MVERCPDKTEADGSIPSTLTMAPEEKNSNKVQAWWKPGIEIFSQVSGWIAAPIILALITGKWLDTRYDTKPWIFLGLTGIAFLISCFGIVRVVKKYMDKISK